MQLVERPTCDRLIAGSNPTRATPLWCGRRLRSQTPWLINKYALEPKFCRCRLNRRRENMIAGKQGTIFKTFTAWNKVMKKCFNSMQELMFFIRNMTEKAKPIIATLLAQNADLFYAFWFSRKQSLKGRLGSNGTSLSRFFKAWYIK